MSARSRFSTSRDGVERATILVRLRVTRELVAWLRAEGGMSEPTALRFLRDNAHAVLDDWTTFGIEPGTGKATTVPTDDADSYETEGWTVYQGDY